MQLTVYLILAHILTDYLFQTEKIAKEKGNRWNILWLHSGTFGILSIILLFPILCWQIGIAITILTFFHVILDKTKVIIRNRCLKFKKNINFELEICDQFAHIVAIVVVAAFIDWQIISFIPTILVKYYLSQDATMIAFYIAGFIFIGKGGTVLVRGILEKTGYMPNEKQTNNAQARSQEKSDNIDSPINEKEYNVGRLIGILERIIILGLAISGEYTAIGFVLAAKSIGRLKDLEENRKFAEYYIVGTLSSVIVALAIALVINWMKQLV